MDNSNMILKYKLKREPIASGSFSDVYLGYDSDGCEYAIKQIDVQKLDPKNQFTISVKQHSRIPMSIMNGCNYEIKDCLKYESYKPYYQIIMENAGTRIDLFDKKIKYNIFLKSFLKYIEG